MKYADEVLRIIETAGGEISGSELLGILNRRRWWLFGWTDLGFALMMHELEKKRLVEYFGERFWFEGICRVRDHYRLPKPEKSGEIRQSNS